MVRTGTSWRTPVGLGLGAGLLTAAMALLGAWGPLEEAEYHLVFRARGARPWDPRVAVVEIDDRSLQALGRYPWPRADLARLLDQLSGAAPAVVLMDLILAEPHGDDPALAAAMARLGTVYLGAARAPRGLPLPPAPLLRAAAAGTGHVLKVEDRDGTWRRVVPRVGTQLQLGWVGAQAWAHLHNMPLELPAGEPLINWPGPVSGLTRVSAVDVLEGRFDVALLADRVVLVGVTATGVDATRSPFDEPSTLAGVHGHAAVVDNALSRGFARDLHAVPPWLLPPWCVALALALWWRRGAAVVVVALAVMLGVGGAAVLALAAGTWLPVAPLHVGTVITVAGVIIFQRARMGALLRARGELMAAISHETRTPLNAVLGLTELVLRTPLTPEQRGHLRTVHASAEILLSMINDILDHARMESGHVVLEPRRTVLRALLEETLALVQARFVSSRGEVTWTVAPGMPGALVVDGARVRQVLLNLLSNAAKYAPGSDVEVHVHTAETGGRQMVRFTVTDHGPGLTRAQQARLFQPFSRIPETHGGSVEGVGLGLAICRRLVTLMGGEIGVESSPGAGCTFHFTVPLVAAPQEVALRGAGATAPPLAGVTVHVDVAHAGVRAMVEAAAREAGATLVDGPGDRVVHVVDDAARARGCGTWLVRADTVATPPRGCVAVPLPLRMDAWVDAVNACLVSAGHAPVTPPAMAVGRRLRVMVVDDHAVNLAVAKSLVEELGHQVAVESRPENVVERVRAERPHVLLLDLFMEPMDGPEVARRVTAALGDAAPRMVGCSAAGAEEDLARFAAAGVTQLLPKPLRMTVLETLLGRASGASQQSLPMMRAEDPQAPPAWDPAVLGSLRSSLGDSAHAVITEVLGLWLGQLDAHMEAIRAGVAAGDAGAVQQAAHALKGNSATVGAMALAACMGHVESAARGGALDQVARHLADAEHVLEATRAAARSELEAARGGAVTEGGSAQP